MSLNLPPNGTAPFDRLLVKGCSLSPAPPAIIIAKTLSIVNFPSNAHGLRNRHAIPIVYNVDCQPNCNYKYNEIGSARGLSMLSLGDACRCAARLVLALMAVEVSMLVVRAR